jgi:hypothetical protein
VTSKLLLISGARGGHKEAINLSSLSVVAVPEKPRSIRRLKPCVHN